MTFPHIIPSQDYWLVIAIMSVTLTISLCQLKDAVKNYVRLI